MDRSSRKPITLVPHSGVQFLTYAFDLESGPRAARTFIERPLPAEKAADGTVPLQLLPGYNEVDPDEEPPHKLQAGDDEYDISNGKALEAFLDRWVPMPFFAVLPGRTADGLPKLDKGPSNWARAKLITADKAETGSTHRLVLAFDTQLVEGSDAITYEAPRRQDALNEREFIMATRFDDLGWFFSDERVSEGSPQVTDYQEWLLAWLKECFHDFKKRQRPGRAFREEDLEHRFEHIARYIAFLHIVERWVDPGIVKLIDTVSEDPFAKPVSIDLVLDIGNSRSCGILIESFAGDDHVDLGNSMVLQLRDLTIPDRTYSEPFESHVELAQADFGPERLSRRSGRLKAFLWPSLVRIGQEAGRFRELAEGTEKTSGMSSPKRYLWDTSPVAQPWSFQPRDYDDPDVPPLIQRSVARYMNPRGDVLAEVERDKGLYRSLVSKSEVGDLTGMLSQLTFSRSSFFTLMVGEIVVQALSMINNYQVRQTRAFTDAPRRLNRLILTLPSAMPVREQRIMRSRVHAALSLVWDLMGWAKVKSSILRQPELIVRWDEASCVQFVYIYTEIVRKFGGDVVGFLDLAGRRRPFAEADETPKDPAPQPSLRLASIDIGGGTTDLMVTTYYEEAGRAIVPVQTFRESFRIAGDDVLKAVIEQVALPCVERHLAACGVTAPRDFLNNRFGGNRANMSEQDKHLRQQFVLSVLRPLGIDLLHAFEAADSGAEESVETLTIGTLIVRGSMAPAAARIEAYLSDEANRLATQAFVVRDVPIDYDFHRIRAAVTSVLDEIFSNMAEVLEHFDCDVVLLAGRPSRLPATVDLLVNKLAVAPDRIVPMHEYRVGAWYPFKTRDNVRISDPKTATVVGGMLCALAERQIVNLTIFTDRLSLRSTARHLGVMERSGKILVENVLFSSAGHNVKEGEAEVTYHAPMRIGYRQLPHRRWTATPLYKMSLGPGRAGIKLPITVTLQRGAPDEDVDFEEVDKFHEGEARKEELKIVDAQDRDGASVARSMQLSLDTMAADDGYWLDTGILTIN